MPNPNNKKNTPKKIKKTLTKEDLKKIAERRRKRELRSMRIASKPHKSTTSSSSVSSARINKPLNDLSKRRRTVVLVPFKLPSGRYAKTPAREYASSILSRRNLNHRKLTDERKKNRASLKSKPATARISTQRQKSRLSHNNTQRTLAALKNKKQNKNKTKKSTKSTPETNWGNMANNGW